MQKTSSSVSVSGGASSREEFKKKLDQKSEENAVLQRMKTMTREEISREAQDMMTGRFKKYYNDLGKDVTEKECRNLAQTVAERVERKRDE